MKYYKIDSAFEKDVQKVEDLMKTLGLSIESEGALSISNKSGLIGRFVDIENGNDCLSFPRFFDNEKIVVED